MWERKELKDLAKKSLNGKFFSAFAVGMIILAFEMISLIVYFLGIINATIPGIISQNPAMMQQGVQAFVPVFQMFTGIFSILVMAPLAVGDARFFVTLTKQGSAKVSLVFGGFKQYWRNVFVMFMTSLFIFLWSLLLIVPGIIKAYSYSMIPFLLAEYPGISFTQARKLSVKMTKGNKWKIFVLQLSFIGWLLASSIGGAFGFGSMFVHPYMRTTTANLYFKLKDLAVESGRVEIAEFEENPEFSI